MLKLGELNMILGADDKGLKQGLHDAKNESGQAGQQAGEAFANRYAGKVRQGTREAGKDFADGKDAFTGVGLAIGLAAGAALTAGILSTLDAAQAKARFTAQLGNAEYARELGEVAGRLYITGFGDSTAENMAAIRAVLSAGLVSEDADNTAIEDITRRAQILARTFGVDVAQAARAAGQMIRTGMAPDARVAFDVMIRGFQQTGDLADDLLETYAEYSTQFRKLGLDAATATGLMTQGVKAGARDIDIVADSIKEFSIRAVDGSQTTAGGFAALGLDAKKMGADIGAGGSRATAALDLTLDRLRGIKDPVAQSSAAVALFGTQAEDMGAALLALDPSTSAAALGTVAGATDRAGQAYQTSAQRLENLKRQVQSALVEKLGQAVPHIERSAQWLKQHEAIVKPLAALLLVFSGAVVAITVAMKVWTAVSAAYTAVQWLLNLSMWGCPLTWIVLGIAAVIAIFVIWWQRSEAFRNFWKQTWDFIVSAAILWWNIFSGFWTTIGSWFVTLFQGWWNLFTGFWSTVFNGVVAYFTWVVDKWNALIGFITGLPGRISAAAHGMWDGIKDSFRAAVNFIIRGWNSLSFHIPSVDTHIPGVGRVGGMTLSVPDIPYLASGGDVTRAGIAMVGERGPERLYLPSGAQVRPLTQRSASPDGRIEVGGEIEVKATCPACGITHLRDYVGARGGNVQAVIGSG